jgi:5-methylcytosine-specific restriction endonuclease McrA
MRRICLAYLIANKIKFQGGRDVFGLLAPCERVLGICPEHPSVRTRYWLIRRLEQITEKIKFYVEPRGKFPRQGAQSWKPLRPLQEAEDKRIQSFYGSYEWKQLRYATLRKYPLRCMCCRNTDAILNVDHIRPIRKYWHLRLDPNNVQILCADCNRGKGNWDEADFRPKPNVVRYRPRIV